MHCFEPVVLYGSCKKKYSFATQHQSNSIHYMSHEIKEHDCAIRPDWAEQSWHCKEQVYPGPIISGDQIPEVAFDVVSEPMVLPSNYVLAGDNCSRLIVAKKPNRNVVIATASPEYEVFSNREILNRVFDAFAENEIPAKLSFALTIKNCAQGAFSFEIEGADEFFCTGKDRHKLYINFLFGHDKTMGLKGFGSATRAVCHNTIQLALRSEKKLFSFTFFHSKKGRAGFENLSKLIEATQHHAQAYSKLAEQLGNKAITQHQAQAIALEILNAKTKESEEVSTRTFNASQKIAQLFKTGKGNSGANMFDLLNGVTEYYTSGDGSGGKSVDIYKKAVSSDFGVAADNKVMFLNAFQQSDGDAISDDQINLLVKRGEALLKSYALAQMA